MAVVDTVFALRPYRSDDDEFITKLSHEAFGEYTDCAGFRTLRMAQRLTTYVALRGKRPIGFVSVEFSRANVASLQAIAVVPVERGRGVGRQLMRAFEKLAAARGAHRLELCTADSNLAALDLFTKLGYRLKKRHRRYYRRGQNACVLAKPFAASG